jgi:SAM-dependent methyltransferase
MSPPLPDQDELTLAAAATASDYDVLPYRSTPYTHTQPARLAAVATLFGMAPPAADHARVLELGCASGGNIIPLAARYPHARFIGIDLSLRQVEDGQRVIAQLGLQNIEIKRGDIGELRLAGTPLDYIVCHGVFSWVPRTMQDAIFRICAENLVANGIAYISYNALPGWHLRRIVRDICHYHAGEQGTPEQRVTRARWMLEQVAKMSSESSTFGRIMRDEVKLTAPLPNSYILGEFLAHDNDPCYFHSLVGPPPAG